MSDGKAAARTSSNIEISLDENNNALDIVARMVFGDADFKDVLGLQEIECMAMFYRMLHIQLRVSGLTRGQLKREIRFAETENVDLLLRDFDN